MNPLRCLPLAAAALLGGCAAVPDLTLGYYPATWKAQVLATRLVWCDEAKTEIFKGPVVSAGSPLYYRDPDGTRQTLRLKALDRWYASTDLTLGLTPDGRLRSVNQTAEGAGETTVRAFAGLASTVKTLTTKNRSTPTPPSVAAACQLIDRIAGAKKPLMVAYEAELARSDLKPSGPDKGHTAALQPVDADQAVITGMLPSLRARIALTDIAPPQRNSTDDEQVLVLQRVQTAVVSIEELGVRGGAPTSWTAADSIAFVVPSAETYVLPIPKPALFGNVKFGLSLLDSGAISSINYGRTPGAAGAANALNEVAKLESPSTRYNQLKAEYDLLSIQNKLARCRADPASC
jgi:hypothetical protein